MHSSLPFQINRFSIFNLAYSCLAQRLYFLLFLADKCGHASKFWESVMKGKNMTLFLPSYLLASIWTVPVVVGAPAVILDHKLKSHT